MPLCYDHRDRARPTKHRWTCLRLREGGGNYGPSGPLHADQGRQKLARGEFDPRPYDVKLFSQFRFVWKNVIFVIHYKA